jgi:dTMP kinase
MKISYIAVCGIEGSGKSTVLKSLENTFKESGTDFISVREPGGTPLAEKCRDMVKYEEDEHISADAELMLFYASRVLLIDNRIIPALTNSKVVLSDRCLACSDAHQKAGGSSPELIDALNEHVVKVKPDLYIYLDVEPELGFSRVDSRGSRDRIEKKDIAYFNKARENYISFMKKQDNVIFVDSNEPMSDVINYVNTEMAKYTY